jgi:hypothetical protein
MSRPVKAAMQERFMENNPLLVGIRGERVMGFTM